MDTTSDANADSTGISCYSSGVSDADIPATVNVAMGADLGGNTCAVSDYCGRGSAGENHSSCYISAVGRDLFRTTCATCARALGDGGDIAG